MTHFSKPYGTTVENLPLTVWLPENREVNMLVMASIHGDETETTIVLSDALRSVQPESLRCAVILAANPDGVLRGTRGNARGVDLNRNLPCENWSKEPVFYKSREGDPQDIRLETGAYAGSEPENVALISLIKDLGINSIVTLHAALACMDDPTFSRLGKELARRTSLPLVEDVGYATPGSFGSWAAENNIPIITYELEADSPYNLKKKHAPVLIDLLTGHIED